MTEKDFDNLIKNALTQDEVPSALNEKLLQKARKKSIKGKIYTFAKFGSAIAAVFICAVVILSYYNPDGDKFADNGKSVSPKVVSSDPATGEVGKARTALPAARHGEDTAPAAYNARMMPEPRSAQDETLEKNKAEITKETALNLAMEACEIPYDTTDVTYDSETSLWCVNFSSQKPSDKNQSIFIDNNGIIQKITFDE